MTVEAVPLDADALDAVLANCWDVSRKELARFGIADPMAVESVLERQPPEYSFALKADGEPIAVFGVWREHEMRYNTWFVAASNFARHGRSATLCMARLFKEKLAAHPGATVILTTTVDDDEARRWFGLLGFSEIRRDPPFVKWGRVAEEAVAA